MTTYRVLALSVKGSDDPAEYNDRLCQLEKLGKSDNIENMECRHFKGNRYVALYKGLLQVKWLRYFDAVTKRDSSSKFLVVERKR